MELKQLEYFRCLCETKNITRAAELLYLSRQSLSVSMKKLEEELGAELFIRQKEGVRLTEAGEIFLEFVKKQEQLFRECRARIAAHREVLRLGIKNSLMAPEEIDRIFSFEQIQSGVNVEIVDDGRDYWQLLQSGELDLAFTVRPPASLKIECIHLYTCEQRILLNRENPLAEKERVDFQRDLAGQTLLETESRLEQHEELLGRLGIRRKTAAADPNLIRTMLQKNKGCVITPKNFLPLYTGEGLVEKELVNMPEEIDLDPCLVHRTDLSPNGRRFLCHILRRYGLEGLEKNC